MPSPIAKLEEVVDSACEQLFHAYGLTAVRDTTHEPVSLALCGIIGVFSESVCGSVILATTHDALTASSPMGASFRRDWIAELTNQLLGRVKNLLLRRGLVCHLSTPVVLRGERIALLPHGDEDTPPLRYRVGGGTACVWLDVEIDANFHLTDDAVPEAAVAEATAIMF
jgi:hypothetical protein